MKSPEDCIEEGLFKNAFEEFAEEGIIFTKQKLLALVL